MMNKMQTETLILNTPLDAALVRQLTAGTLIRLNGTIYTARDAAHKRLLETLEAGRSLPINLSEAVIYYVGPTPGTPGQAVGSAGPTTSTRMDSYTPRLLEAGLKVMIGKGPRNSTVIEAMRKHGAVYLAATGGAGALLGRCITKAEVVDYPELGPEALRRLEVKDFPVLVAVDSQGTSLYK